MSKNSDKGRKGELAVTAIISNVGVHEPGVEVIRSSLTTTPENGVDLAIRCPHNLREKLDEIASNGDSKIALAKNSQIDVRIQVKNYDRPINKAVAQSFVDEIHTNPRFDEHWGMGGSRLTKGAREVLDKAQELAPVRWYTADEIDRIQDRYKPIPFTRINRPADDS
jgi:hypothetical protein